MKMNLKLTSFLMSLSLLASSCSGDSTSDVIKKLDSLVTEQSFSVFTAVADGYQYSYDYETQKVQFNDKCKIKTGERLIAGVGGFGESDIKHEDYYIFSYGYDGDEFCIEKKILNCRDYPYTYIPNSILDNHILIFNDEDGNEAKMMKINLGNHFPSSEFEYYIDDVYNSETDEAYVFATKEALYFGSSYFSMVAEDYSLDDNGNLARNITNVIRLDGNKGGGYSLFYIPLNRALFDENTEKFYYLTDVISRSSYQSYVAKNNSKYETPKYIKEVKEETSAIKNSAQQQTSPSSARSYRPFSSEWDVRSFLTSNTFVSKDGDRISFREQGNQMYYNGNCISSIIQIGTISKNSATFVYKGPYGTGGFAIVNEEWAQSLMEASTRKYYDAE